MLLVAVFVFVLPELLDRYFFAMIPFWDNPVGVVEAEIFANNVPFVEDSGLSNLT